MPINTCSKLPKPYALCRTFFFFFLKFFFFIVIEVVVFQMQCRSQIEISCFHEGIGVCEQLMVSQLWTTFFILFSLGFYFYNFFHSSKQSCLLFKNWMKYLFGGLSMFFILKIYNNKILLFWLLYRKAIENDLNEYYSVALRNLEFV